MNETVDVDYVTLDVFTDRAFGGNPLAVVPDARGLDPAEMQAIAREFHYSETTFLLPPDDAGATAKLRIFTPLSELPFAGHPNVGTGFVAARMGTLFGRPLGEQLLFEELAGLIQVSILVRNGSASGARVAAPKHLRVGPPVPAEIVAECLGLATADVAGEPYPPVIASVGLPFLFAELKSAAALAKCRPAAAGFARHLPPLGTDGIEGFVRDGSRVQARVFVDHGTIIEDPATGSANLALVALLADRTRERDTEVGLDIAQGVHMGRPSRLAARAVKASGKVLRAEIAGDCVEVMRGRLSFTRQRA